MMSEKTELNTARSQPVTAEDSSAELMTEGVDEPAIGRFAEAVAQIVDQRLTPDAVEARLAQLRRAAENQSAWHDDKWARLIAELARYAHQVVRSWIAIVASVSTDTAGWSPTERSLPTLTEQDAEDLTNDIVARAVTGFQEELGRARWWLKDERPDMKVLFLLECALQLPDAHRSWLLRTDRLSWDEDEQIASASDASTQHQPEFLVVLQGQLRDERVRVRYLLKASRYSDLEVVEIIDATLDMFALAAGTYPTRIRLDHFHQRSGREDEVE
jgi:hypothetical protein